MLIHKVYKHACNIKKTMLEDTLAGNHAKIFYESTYGCSLEEARKKARTLYEQLIIVDQYKEVCQVMGNSDFVCSSAHEKLIQQYRGNPFLERALANTQSLEEAAWELYEQKYAGIKKFLPHKKDLEYNQKLKQLGKLVKIDCILETESMFRPNCALNTLIYGLLIGAGGGLLYQASDDLGKYSALIPLTFGGFVGISTGIIASITNAAMHEHIKRTFQEQTHYLDEKIKKLF